MDRRMVTAGALACALALPLVRLSADDAPAPSPAPGPTLTGRWRFNAEASDDARAKMREAFEHHGGGGGGMGGGRGGMGGGRGGGYGGGGGGGYGGGGGGHMGGRPGGGGPGGGMHESMRDLVEAPPSLVVTQTAAEITMVEEDGRFRAFHADKKEYKDTEGREVRSRFEGQQLVVESKGERFKTVETYAVAGEPSRLTVTLRLETGRGDPVTIKRVYDAAPPE